MTENALISAYSATVKYSTRGYDLLELYISKFKQLIFRLTL